MKIIIFGLARSGTTALFYLIKNSLPPDTVCLFEPRSFDPGAAKKKTIKSLLTRRQPDVLTKVLPFRPHHSADIESFSQFEKQILLVRDPRDQVISRLLYGLYDADFSQHDDRVTTFNRLLRQKETDPSSVTLINLFATFAALNGESFSLDGWSANYRRHSIKKPLDFVARHQSIFLFKYEDMIDRQLEGLEKYLGLRLQAEPLVAPEFARVTRTRSYGGWRDWFTAEDVQYLRPVMQQFLERHYLETDWQLNPSPSIPAEHCSLYVERIVNDRRRSLKLPPYVSRDGAGQNKVQN